MSIPDEPAARFVFIECPGCGSRSPVAREPTRDGSTDASRYWYHAHFEVTGHARFYVWRLERGTGHTRRF